MPEDEIGTEAEPGAGPESPGSSAGTRRTWLIVLVAVAVVAVAVVGGLALHRRKSAKGPAVTFEAAASAGVDSFTNSVAVGTPPTFPSNVRAIIAELRSKLRVSKKTNTLVATGTAPGVYGGNGASSSCDTQALVTYLTQNPGNARAWAKASHIAPARIPEYVAALTPVVLTNDTRVTNHGYNNAAPAPRQSLLQAGTAVMVDATGIPRVLCTSGNPLSPAHPVVITKTRGKAWPGYSAKDVTTITPGPVTHTLTILNIQTGQYYQQPTGAAGAAPISITGQWVVAEPIFANDIVQSTTILAVSTGRPWAPMAGIPHELVSGIAWGDGKWIAVTNANFGGKGNHVLESSDLHDWKQVAALPNRLTGIAFGAGRWTATALHYTAALGPSGATGAGGVIYTSTDAVHWTQTASTGGVANSRRQPVAYGNGEWLTVVGSNNTTSGTPVPTLSMFTSQDGLHWTDNRSRITGQMSPSLAFRGGTWALGSAPATDGSAVVNTSLDARFWSQSSTGLGRGGIAAIAGGANGWMLVLSRVTSLGPVSTFHTSPNAKVWTTVGSVRSSVSALAYRPPVTVPTSRPSASGVTTTTGAAATPS